MTTETEPTQSLPVNEKKSEGESDRSNSESLQKKQDTADVEEDYVGLDKLIGFLKEIVNIQEEGTEETKQVVALAINKCRTTIDKIRERKNRGPKKSIDKKVSETPIKEKPKEMTEEERFALRCEWAGMND